MFGLNVVIATHSLLFIFIFFLHFETDSKEKSGLKYTQFKLHKTKIENKGSGLSPFSHIFTI